MAWWLEGREDTATGAVAVTWFPEAALEAEAGVKLPPGPPILLAPPGVYTRHSSEELRSPSVRLRSGEKDPLVGAAGDQAIALVSHSQPGTLRFRLVVPTYTLIIIHNYI